MHKNSSLGDRMKRYEEVTRSLLIPKQPVIVRIDGRNFKKFTSQKWVQKPFDTNITKAFWSATLQVCKEVSNICLAYHQSDEVTFVLKDYRSVEDSQFFEGNVQKISSIFASKFSNYFNFALLDLGIKSTLGEFDARCFNLSKEETVNNLIWRQRDAERNSINSFTLSYFGHKAIEGLNSLERIQMLSDKDIDIDLLLPNEVRLGVMFYKIIIEEKVKDLPEAAINQMIKMETPPPEMIERSKWTIDLNTPRFDQNKQYLETIIN